MAFIGPLDAFNSEPIQTPVPGSTEPLFTATSTKVTKDTSGKVTGAKTTVYYSATAGNYVPAATTTDGGKTWTYLKDSKGKEILGADAKKSLQQGALKTNTQQQILAATKQRLAGGGLSPEEQKIVAPSTENTASGKEEDITGAQNKVDKLSGPGAISFDEKRNRDIKNYPENALLKYPIDLNPKEQDFISFTMLKYSPKKYNDLTSLGESGKITERDSQEKRFGSRVVLPIQPSISDTNTVEWGSDTMDAQSLIAASLALNTIIDGAKGAEETVNQISNLIGKGSEDIKTAYAAGFAGAAAGTKGLLTRVTGGIVNPNMELLFNGPQLRSFQFNFTLSAREEKESKVIRNIIRFFKQGMSVKRSTTDLFLQSPNTFQIKYHYKGNDKDHPWINKIKECALISCSVNYTPAQNYATFIDGAMTSYEISLQFSELEALYDDDYKNSGGKGNESEIGY
jgi:hypothetical protein